MTGFKMFLRNARLLTHSVYVYDAHKKLCTYVSEKPMTNTRVIMLSLKRFLYRKRVN